MAYKVSIIVPVYNVAKYLKQNFESLKMQSIGFENLEIIYCDDCSTDGGYEMLCKLAEEYENVRVVRTKTNTGAAGAPRNIGLDNATAPYIMFLDGDDRFFSGACEALYNAITQEGVDIASGEEFVNDEDEHSKSRWTLQEFKYDTYDLAKKLTHDDLPIARLAWTKIYKKEIIEAHRLRMSECCIFEDLMFLCFYLSYCKRAERIREPVYEYNVYSGSISHTVSYFNYVSMTKCLNEAIERGEKEENTERIVDFMGCNVELDNYFEDMFKSKTLTDEQITEILLSCRSPFSFLAKNGVVVWAPSTKILLRDLTDSDMEQTKADFYDLRDWYRQRQAEISGILNSRTWKLLTLVNKLKFWEK